MSKIDFKGSVVLNPVPVVLITCRNNEGKDNVFTVAWTGTICTKPPMLSISIRPERLSYEYIKESMEFTVNLPNYRMVKETDFCGVKSGRDVDKIKEMKFTMNDGSKVSSPYIDQCPINIECKVSKIIPLGTHDIFLAEVVESHIDSSVIDEKGKIHFEWAKLISYCHGEYFPMSTDAIGKFGFSIAKNENLKKQYLRYEKNYEKLLSKDTSILHSNNQTHFKDSENIISNTKVKKKISNKISSKNKKKSK